VSDATGEYLSAEEVEELTGEKYPLDAEEPEEFPQDEGDPEVSEDEAAETGTDAGEEGGGNG
jgi:hypothetical protein